MRVLATSLLALLIAAPASAQPANPAGTGNPAGMMPGTKEQAPGLPAPHQTNVPDRVFIINAYIGGVAEIGLGRLAERSAGNDAVKAFARRMIEDHSKANATLAALANTAAIPLPQELDPEHKAVQDRLSKLSGAQFDIEYLRVQVQDHQRTVQLLEYEIGSGQDAEIQRFAAQTLPLVIAHLQLAQAQLTQLSGQHPDVAMALPKATGQPTPQTPPAAKN